MYLNLLDYLQAYKISGTHRRFFGKGHLLEEACVYPQALSFLFSWKVSLKQWPAATWKWSSRCLVQTHLWKQTLSAPKSTDIWYSKQHTVGTREGQAYLTSIPNWWQKSPIKDGATGAQRVTFQHVQYYRNLHLNYMCLDVLGWCWEFIECHKHSRSQICCVSIWTPNLRWVSAMIELPKFSSLSSNLLSNHIQSIFFTPFPNFICPTFQPCRGAEQLLGMTSLPWRQLQKVDSMGGWWIQMYVKSNQMNQVNRFESDWICSIPDRCSQGHWWAPAGSWKPEYCKYSWENDERMKDMQNVSTCCMLVSHCRWYLVISNNKTCCLALGPCPRDDPVEAALHRRAQLRGIHAEEDAGPQLLQSHHSSFGWWVFSSELRSRIIWHLTFYVQSSSHSPSHPRAPPCHRTLWPQAAHVAMTAHAGRPRPRRNSGRHRPPEPQNYDASQNDKAEKWGSISFAFISVSDTEGMRFVVCWDINVFPGPWPKWCAMVEPRVFSVCPCLPSFGSIGIYRHL